MPAYEPPVPEILSILREVLAAEAQGLDLATLEAVLAEGGRFCGRILAPLNASGDAEGCRIEQGNVRTPSGFPEAYQKMVEAGWPALSQPERWGGQAMPRLAQLALDEFTASTNFAFGLFPGLTRGAAEAIARHATPELQETYLPKMVSGEWAGAMALTEAQAGTDLGLLTTRAEPRGDGSLSVSGSKIFITAGDHDLAGNIIHLVLARLPDAPPGVRGISLVLVPKFLPDDQGRPGPRNAMAPIGLEQKMGIHASPTCVMQYDGAQGWLVGAPHRGLAAMFTMMNAERLFVGIQGLGIAEAAGQAAGDYARTRLQGRAPGVAAGPPQPILVHPDVRRMLLTIRGFTGAGRALALWLAILLDRAEDDAEAEGLVALLTPVVKAAFTDLGFEAAVLGQQVLGGAGYLRELGLEQMVRDARIAPIYEGTNGVQAMDLVTRKLAAEDGALPHRFFARVRADGADEPELIAALDRLEAATRQLQRAGADPAEPGAAAADYLRLFALVALGWMWRRMRVAAGASEQPHHRRWRQGADFFFARLLPQSAGLAAAIAAGPATLMAPDDDIF
ncbi:acyl-CoA dehydrogenase [Roseomonas sp. 18066]|uniref:acyl-CoA dehydrogenase n=1 Tax=Roseomonas sp. 18066 TaxID=2681412 RepID=UPI001357491A|nr:acyl-CoA dehydrogenase [Roseomonas sp. 18066]